MKIKKFFSSKNIFTINVILPDLKKINIELKLNSSINDFENELRKIKNFEYLEIRNWDFSIISKNSNLNNVLNNSNEPVFIRVDRMEWQEIYHKDLSNKDNNKQLLRKINKNKKLTDIEIIEIEEEINKLKNIYNNKLNDKLISNYKNISDIFKNYYDLKYEFNILKAKLDKIEKISQIKALCLILLSGSLFVIELFCLYYGTFMLYSWDIIEPITYITTCFNILLLIIAKRKFGKNSPHQYFKNLFFKRKIKSSKFNLENYDDIKNKILLIKNKLNI